MARPHENMARWQECDEKKRRHNEGEEEDSCPSPKNPRTVPGCSPRRCVASSFSRPPSSSLVDPAGSRRAPCCTPPPEPPLTSPPTKRPPQPFNAQSVCSAAGCAEEKSEKPETPYHPICLGFFARQSPVPNRPLAQTTFPKCLSPALRHPPVPISEWRRQLVEQEQAELLALFYEAESEGAVALTGSSTLLAPP